MSAQDILHRVNESLRKYEKQLELDQYPILNVAHEKTHQPRIYIALAGAFIVSTIIIQLLGLSFISNCFAFVPSKKRITYCLKWAYLHNVGPILWS